jgi:hypothetical protein
MIGKEICMAAALIILGIHFLLVLIFCLLGFLHVIRLSKAELPLLIFLPFVGELAVLLISMEYRGHLAGRRSSDLEAMSQRTNERTGYISPESNDNQAIPLEDALILDDSRVRRESMMDLLLSRPENYMDSLRQARMNSDVEVVHYATTALSEASKEYDERLQRAGMAYRKNPESREAMDSYIDVLEDLITNRMAEGQLLSIYQGRLGELLAKRIEKCHEPEDYRDLAALDLDRRMMDQARALIEEMKDRFPDWTGTLWCQIRYYYETGQGEKLRKLAMDVRDGKCFNSQEAKELAEFWVEKTGQDRTGGMKSEDIPEGLSEENRQKVLALKQSQSGETGQERPGRAEADSDAGNDQEGRPY